MKKLFILTIMVLPLCVKGQKNQVTLGTFIPPLSTIMGMYEYKISLGKQSLGLGLTGLYRNPPRVNATEFSITPKVNYYVLKKKAGNIFLGAGCAFGKLEEVSRVDFRLQGGLDVHLVKNLGLKLEFSNYMFTDNGVGISGGLAYGF